MTKIQKTCKHCQSNFFVEYEPKGSGSGNVARKKYCSDLCKKLYSKRSDNLFKRVENVCSVCEKIFKVFPSHAVSRVTCSKMCYDQHMSKVNKRYAIVDKKCLTCDVMFSCNENHKQKYCSLTCFKKNLERKKEIRCGFCAKTFWIKKSSKAKYCNSTCSRKALSLGLIKNHANGRTGWRKDIENSPYFKSSLEADYARYCIHNNVKFEYEKEVFTISLGEKVRHYTPDFYLPDSKEFVELKGLRQSENLFSKMLNSNSEAREELKRQGLNIKVIYMNDFYEMLRQTGLWEVIPNLENKNYAKTAHLIQARKNQPD